MNPNFRVRKMYQMRANGFLPFVLLLLLVVVAYVGHSQGSCPVTVKSLVPNMPFDGGLFLLLSAGLIYGGKVLYRKD